MVLLRVIRANMIVWEEAYVPLIYRPSPGKKKKETLKIMYIYRIC
jgi:hypothetical protein